MFNIILILINHLIIQIFLSKKWSRPDNYLYYFIVTANYLHDN